VTRRERSTAAVTCCAEALVAIPPRPVAPRQTILTGNLTEPPRPWRHASGFIGIQAPPIEASKHLSDGPLASQPSRISFRARDLPETALHVALRCLTSQPSAEPPSCAIVRGRGVPLGVVSHRRIDGMQGVRGSNPLSSTTGQGPSPPSTAACLRMHRFLATSTRHSCPSPRGSQPRSSNARARSSTAQTW
jgi:hypothetical protein